jgi:hypothetical protein
LLKLAPSVAYLATRALNWALIFSAVSLTSVEPAVLAAADQLVQGLAAEARFFQDQLETYRQNPALYRDRLRVDTITRILTNSSDKFFLPSRADGERREVRIQLNREPQPQKRPELGR